jgi:lysophospholipase L1-like esterase
MRRGLKWVGILIGLLIIIGGSLWWFQQRNQSTTSTTTHHVTPTKSVRVVAVGDSLTQGIGYADDHQGYLPMLKQQLETDYRVKVRTQNFGIGGERSDQIDQRVTHKARLRLALKRADVIAVTVGGNDLLQKLEKNILVDSSSQLAAKLAPAKVTYQQKLTQLIQDIHQVNPKAQVYLFGIYNPVYVYFSTATMITDAVDQWNQVNQKVASQVSGTHFVTINQQLSYGQYQSASAQAKLKRENKKTNQQYVDPAEVEKLLQDQTSDEKNDYLSTHDHFHPNKRGYTIMAKQLKQAIGQHVNWSARN